MNRVLTIIGPLWRLCTNFVSFKSLPGGAAGLQIWRTEFESQAACQGQDAEWLGAGLQPQFREFDSHLALQLVVTPTRFPRIGERCLAGA